MTYEYQFPVSFATKQELWYPLVSYFYWAKLSPAFYAVQSQLRVSFNDKYEISYHCSNLKIDSSFLSSYIINNLWYRLHFGGCKS